MKFPTIAIQLATDDGLPYDLPDDWIETAIQISSMLHSKYKCGINIVYGMAEGKHLDKIESEVYNYE